MTLTWKNLIFCSWYWNLDRPNCEKVQLIIIFCQFSYSYSSTATAWVHSSRSPWRFFLPTMGFFIKLICCWFDQSYLIPIDGQYPSAIAPPDNCSAILGVLKVLNSLDYMFEKMSVLAPKPKKSTFFVNQFRFSISFVSSTQLFEHFQLFD